MEINAENGKYGAPKMPKWFKGKSNYKFVISKNDVEILEGEELAEAIYFLFLSLKKFPDCDITLKYIVEKE